MMPMATRTPARPNYSESPSRMAKPSALGKVRPFKSHAQVSAVPVVANLTDDNGDGRINELDSPEIIFPAFCGQDYQCGGMLRAVHGGGMKVITVLEGGVDVSKEVSTAGEDYFAICGGKLWKEGMPVPAVGSAEDCTCNQGDLEPNGGVAVGDLDADGFPEVVYMGHAGSNGENNRLVIYRNDGELITQYSLVGKTFKGPDPAVALANIDHTGLAEVIVGSTVIYLKVGDQRPRSGQGAVPADRRHAGHQR